MFFTDEELKAAEELAWQMLEGWNHAYMPDLRDHVYFYYKDQIIMDPWMNEKCQNCIWSDHVSAESAVDPVKYYGQNTIEDYVVNLFMSSPEFAPEITEKIRGRLDESGRLLRTSTIMPIEVYVAMPEEQAEEEHGHTCVEWELPDSKRIYFDMMELPENLVRVISRGWQREIAFRKKDAKKVLDILYPSGIKFKYKNLINRVYGEEVRLIGFGA